jgi:hypothetical protein
MKYVCILIAGMLLSTSASAQTGNEWFRQKETQKKYLIQQVAALQLYLKYLKEGYDIAKKGLNVIGDIKEGQFDLDSDYLTSLRSVNSSIGRSATITRIIVYQRMLIRQFEKLENDSDDSEYLTAHEKLYVSSVYSNVIQESDRVIEELERVLSENDLEMKDDERIKQIDELYADSKDMYSFSRSFSKSTRLMINQRSIEDAEMKIHERLTND